MSTPLRERPDAPLGTLIFRAGLLPADAIESALEEGVRTGKRLGEVLVDRGLLDEADLARLLAGQRSLRFVTLRQQIVDPAATSLFSPEQARLFRSLPYTFEDGEPVVAVADPADDVLLRNIREAIGYREVRFVVATRSELASHVAEVYAEPRAEPVGATARPEAVPFAPAPAPEPPAAHPPELLRTVPLEPPPVVEPPAATPIPLQRPEPAPQPQAPTPYEVAVRLTTGERVGAGSFPDLAAAKRRAQELMTQAADPDGGDWPFASGRFLKPDAIVSVDIAEPADGGLAAAATGS